jgi:hypothetical protein
MPTTRAVPDDGLEGGGAAASPAEVRAHLDDLIARRPELFEQMASREIRRLRPKLQDDEALSIAYDAALAVARLAERSPVRLDTVLGLVRTYVRWSALDRMRQVAPQHEVPVGIGHDLAAVCGPAERDALARLILSRPGRLSHRGRSRQPADAGPGGAAPAGTAARRSPGREPAAQHRAGAGTR